MSTTTTPAFNHLPGEEANRLALKQIACKDSFYKWSDKLSLHEERNQKLMALTPAAITVIVLLSIFCISFSVADGIFSWDVFKDKISPDLLGANRSNNIYTFAIIAFFCCVAIAGSIMLKQPFSKAIPNLDMNNSTVQQQEFYSGQAQGLRKYKPRPKRKASDWVWFSIGVLSFIAVMTVIFRMSVEREAYIGESRGFETTMMKDDIFGTYLPGESNAQNSHAVSDKLPISVFLPVLFKCMEYATGWALLPLILLISFSMKRAVINGRMRSFGRRATKLYNDIITVFPAYASDIKDFNQKYSRNERPVSMTPQLREVIHIYNENGNALTRMRRITNLDEVSPALSGTNQENATSTETVINSGGSSEQAQTQPPISPSPQTITANDEENISDINFFDNTSII